jgi:hypothetical protein
MSALSLLSGVFFVKDGSPFVSSGSGEVPVLQFLGEYSGRRCDLVLHHLPTDPILPGSGTCLLGPYCAFHNQEPSSIFEFSSSGILRLESDSVMIDDSILTLENMYGHYGRMIVFSPPETCKVTSSFGDLLDSSIELSSILSSLKDIL